MIMLGVLIFYIWISLFGPIPQNQYQDSYLSIIRGPSVKVSFYRGQTFSGLPCWLTSIETLGLFSIMLSFLTIFRFRFVSGKTWQQLDNIKMIVLLPN